MDSKENKIFCLLGCKRVVEQNSASEIRGLCELHKKKICAECQKVFKNLKEIGQCRINKCRESVVSNGHSQLNMNVHQPESKPNQTIIHLNEKQYHSQEIPENNFEESVMRYRLSRVSANNENYFKQTFEEKIEYKVEKRSFPKKTTSKLEHAKSKKCPRCKIPTKMENECKLLVCGKKECNNLKFCYLCEKLVIDSDKAKHFPNGLNADTCVETSVSKTKNNILPEQPSSVKREEIVDPNLVNCPKCRFAYLFDGGCKFLTCTSAFCKGDTHFCFLCKKKLNVDQKTGHYPAGIYGDVCQNMNNIK